MKTIARVLVFGALLSVGSTHALTVAYITEGPMMRNARLAKFVGPQIGNYLCNKLVGSSLLDTRLLCV